MHWEGSRSISQQLAISRTAIFLLKVLLCSTFNKNIGSASSPRCWNQSIRLFAFNCREQSTMKLIQIIIGILLPPLGVFLTYGFSSTLLINIGLTLLGWVPGIIHAVWAISKQQET
jgi:uncharacterized membrane protein YqaE (UPF0057 family)